MSWMKFLKNKQRKLMNWTRKLESCDKKGNDSVTMPSKNFRISRIFIQELSESMQMRSQPSRITKLSKKMPTKPSKLAQSLRQILGLSNRLTRNWNLLSLARNNLGAKRVYLNGFLVARKQQPTTLLLNRLLLRCRQKFKKRGLRVIRKKQMKGKRQSLSFFAHRHR